jgi:hypothetical protein
MTVERNLCEHIPSVPFGPNTSTVPLWKLVANRNAPLAFTANARPL